MDEGTARMQRWQRWERQTRRRDPIVRAGTPLPLGWMPHDAAWLLCRWAYRLQEAGDGRLHQPLRNETFECTVDASRTGWTGGMHYAEPVEPVVSWGLEKNCICSVEVAGLAGERRHGLGAVQLCVVSVGRPNGFGPEDAEEPIGSGTLWGRLAKNLEAEGLQNEMTHIHDEHCRRTVGILSLLCLIPSPASFRESSFARRNISDDAVTVAWIASSLCYLMTVAHGTHKSASCISSAEFV
jgi:hypothetical protein